MKKIKIVLFAFLFIISSGLVIRIHVFNIEKIDPEYAVSVFEEDITTRQFEFSAFNQLDFLADTDSLTTFSKKTNMLGAIPVLKIVNSNEYRVEIKTNADVFDVLKIATSDTPNRASKTLVITFADACYIPVHTDDISYDYDTGLYVDFDIFEVTVYAPISLIDIDSKIILDYQAPACEELYMLFTSEGTEANIYDINAENLKLYCSGTSNITLSGKVKGKSEISIFHQTKVDATDFETNTEDFYISSSVLFGFSYIKYNGATHFDFSENTFQLGVAAILYIPPIIWLACLISCFCKKRKDKQKSTHHRLKTIDKCF